MQGEVLTLALAGTWRVGCGIPPTCSALQEQLQAVKKVLLDVNKLEGWDSAMLAFMTDIATICSEHKIEFDRSNLPDNAQKLIDLAIAVPEKKDASQKGKDNSGVLVQLGNWAFINKAGTLRMARFIGEITESLGRLFTGKAQMRSRDFWAVMMFVSVDALPIVSMIAFLIGLIIAFLGAVVLVDFGANHYVSYLVSYGMLREMGAVMTGVIMAGRTGSAFAAKLGSMKVTEEIDALRTLGISPVDFLVLPRLLALSLMLPLLVIYADFIGIFGGMLVSTFMLDVPYEQFLSGMKVAVAPPSFYLGVVKGLVFGMTVAITGCQRGLQAGKGSDAVGVAATNAVVTGISLIILFNAIIDWIAAIYGF